MAMYEERLGELIERDISEGLAAFLEPTRDGLSALDTFGDVDEPIASPVYEALPWQWEGRHVGVLAGVPPTGRTVIVRGVTFVDVTGDEPVFHRFVDWLGVLEQLGTVVVGRPAVDAFPGELPGRDRYGMLESQQSEESAED